MDRHISNMCSALAANFLLFELHRKETKLQKQNKKVSLDKLYSLMVQFVCVIGKHYAKRKTLLPRAVTFFFFFFTLN